MMLLRLLEVIGIILIAAFIFTQVVLPAIGGGKLFPLFRKSRMQLEREISEKEEQLTEKHLKERLKELDAQLNDSPDQK